MFTEEETEENWP